MAAKKNTKKGAKFSEETKPAQQPVKAPEQREESPPTPADDAPVENKPGQPGPPVAGIGASAGGLAKIQEVEARDPRIAQALRRLAEGFQYQKLLDLFSTEGLH